MTAATLGRRVTPAAVQILPASAPEEQWLAERRKGIGSSDIAAIVGVADRRQAVHVYHDKRGHLTDDDAGEAALWGKLHEDTVAREWCRRNRSVIRRVGLVANQAEPMMLTTLDRLVTECPLGDGFKCALEVKTRSAFKSAKWHREVPDDVLAQTLWQRIVTGLDHIHVACLIGGNDYRQTVVRPDEDTEAYLRAQGNSFWNNHVKVGVEPVWNFDVDHPEDLLDLDKRLHGERVGELDLLGIDAALGYVEASAAASRAEKERKAAAARLAQLADGHRFLKFDNRLVYHYRTQSRANCDLAALAERHPDAYRDCVSDTTFDVIQVSSQFKKEHQS